MQFRPYSLERTSSTSIVPEMLSRSLQRYLAKRSGLNKRRRSFATSSMLRQNELSRVRALILNGVSRTPSSCASTLVAQPRLRQPPHRASVPRVPHSFPPERHFPMFPSAQTRSRTSRSALALRQDASRTQARTTELQKSTKQRASTRALHSSTEEQASSTTPYGLSRHSMSRRRCPRA